MTAPTNNDAERETAALLGQLKVEPSAAARARAFEKLQVEFAAHSRLQSAPRRLAPRWALAAGLTAVVVAGVTFLSLPSVQPTAVVARVESIDGAVELRGAGVFGGATRLAANGAIATGQTLDVAAGAGVLLRLSPALSVRLAAGTRAKVAAADELELTSGQAYVDATPGAQAPLRIVTPYGIVTHLGTQYLVRLDSGAVEVAVREGRAQLATDAGTRVAVQGTWLLQRAGMAPIAGILAADDSRFEWLATLPSKFHLEGATLAQFLGWFTRETGIAPVYSAGVDAGNFAHVQLKGSIDDLDPFEALSYVLASADLSWHREGAKVVIESAAPPRR